MLDQTASSSHSLLTLGFGCSPPKQDPQSFPKACTDTQSDFLHHQKTAVSETWQEHSVFLAAGKGKEQISKKKVGP